jgi:hypothetical protein
MTLDFVLQQILGAGVSLSDGEVGEGEGPESEMRVTVYKVPGPVNLPHTSPTNPASGTGPSGTAALNDLHFVFYNNGFQLYRHDGTNYVFVDVIRSTVTLLPEYQITAANMGTKTAQITSANQVYSLLMLSVEGIEAISGDDFTFSNSTGLLSWSGLGLDGRIQEGDTITGIYQ